MKNNYVYYKVSLKLLTPMLGTGTEVSIYHEHVLQKAKKEIEKANKLAGKLSKAMAKYKGSEITPQKELEEIQGLLRAQCQIVGKQVDIPNDVDGVLALAGEIQKDIEESLKEGQSTKATVFIKDKDGMPLVGTHMILGNLKENMKAVVNGGDKDVIKSKTAVSEALALDVKFVENFMKPDKDILKGDQAFADALQPLGRGRWVAEQSGRIILERPIRFNRMGKEETAIAMSEVLPEGSEMSCTMRVRAGSPLTMKALEDLLDLGKNKGLGSWRGSGNMGAFVFKLEELPDYKETFEGGWK